MHGQRVEIEVAAAATTDSEHEGLTQTLGTAALRQTKDKKCARFSNFKGLA